MGFSCPSSGPVPGQGLGGASGEPAASLPTCRQKAVSLGVGEMLWEAGRAQKTEVLTPALTYTCPVAWGKSHPHSEPVCGLE